MYQVQGVDLPTIFLAAQQARANEQAQQMNAIKLAEMQRQQQTQRWLPQARIDYAQGEPTDLLRLAPEEAMGFDRAQAEQRKRQFDMALAARQAEQQQLNASIDPAAKIVMNQYGYEPGSPDYRSAYAAVREKLAREELAARRAGAQQINIGKEGNIGLEKGVAAKAQQSVLDADALIGELDAMDTAIEKAGGTDKLLSYGGQASAWLAGKADKIAPEFTSDEWKDLITAHKSVDMIIASVRNKILNDYYGGAISEGEMKRGLQMLPNRETDSPTEFTAKKVGMRQRLVRARDRGVKALVEGIESVSKPAAPGEESQTSAQPAATSTQEPVVPGSLSMGAPAVLPEQPPAANAQAPAASGLSEADAKAAETVRGFMQQEGLPFEAAVLKAVSRGVMSQQAAQQRIAKYRERQQAGRI